MFQTTNQKLTQILIFDAYDIAFFLFFKWGYTIKTLGYEEVVGICWNDLSGM